MNVPNKDLCDVTDDSSIRPGNMPSHSVDFMTETWISMDKNEKFPTGLRLDIKDEFLEVGDERA